eukprot:12797931-Ditylum_brightwellii.AAC.1
MLASAPRSRSRQWSSAHHLGSCKYTNPQCTLREGLWSCLQMCNFKGILYTSRLLLCGQLNYRPDSTFP